MMQSEHSLQEKHIREESLRTWVGDVRPDFGEEEAAQRVEPAVDRVSISAEAMAQRFNVIKKTDTVVEAAEETLGEDPRLRTMRLVLEALTGKKIKVTSVDNFTAEQPATPATLEAPNGEAVPDEQERAGWGLEYDYFEQYSEEEMMNFSSQGTIVTQDGKQIEFSLELAMQREFVETNSISIRAGDALLVDPLVINFDGVAAQLTDTRFSFDLDADGTEEGISFVGPGSGFLFIDRDKNGMATDGAELFGPSTNNGFAELAEYDLDENGWIDENDPIYEKLLVWSRNWEGDDYITSLSQRNVGAIFLGREETEFSIKDRENTLKGQVRNTGIYLTGDYRAGSIQEVHLTV